MKSDNHKQTPIVNAEQDQHGGISIDETEIAFHNLSAVLKFLQDQGWKVTKPSLYRHHKEGKFRPDPDGSYKQRTVIKYAKAFLKLTATGKRQQDTTDDLQREKLQEELKNLKLKNIRDKFNYEKDQGHYIPKAQMDIEIASIIGVLVSGFKYLITSNAAAWIALSGGDHKKTGEVITKAIDDVDEFTNTIANTAEYEVVIEAEENECGPFNET